MTMRRAGRMHHLGIGAAHARKRVLAIADDTRVTVTDLTTGEVLSTHHIEPDKSYWRNQNNPRGRWPERTAPRPITRDTTTMELGGFEPPTFRLPAERSPS
jgi:hypothetical protein